MTGWQLFVDSFGVVFCTAMAVVCGDYLLNPPAGFGWRVWSAMAVSLVVHMSVVVGCLNSLRDFRR